MRWLYEDAARRSRTIRARLAGRIGATRFGLTGDALGFAVERDGLIGDCSATSTVLTTSAEHRQGEIGFVLHPDHQGRGYATEAAARAARARLRHASACTASSAAPRPATSPRPRVLEKLGMRREAHLVENELVKGEWQSERYACSTPTAAQSQPRRRK